MFVHVLFHVLFRSRRHESPQGNPRVPDHDDAGTHDAAPPQTQQLQHWRQCAQRVTRAWNAWLAAERRDRGVRYRAFVAALADEDRAAAELQRRIELSERSSASRTTEPRNSRLSAL